MLCLGSPFLVKQPDQNVKHPVRHLPSVVSKIKLTEILRQVLPRDVDVSSTD